MEIKERNQETGYRWEIPEMCGILPSKLGAWNLKLEVLP